MDVTAAAIGIHHLFIPAIECTHTQFDLGKVEVQKLTSGCRHNELSYTDGIATLPGHVLQIGIPGGKPTCVSTHRHQVGMNLSCRRVDALLIAVDVGAFDLRPFPQLLHRIEEFHQFGARLLAVGLQQLDRLIICCLLEFCCCFQHRQLLCAVQIILKGCGGAVGSNIHVANHHQYLFPQLHYLLLCFLLLFLHECCIHTHTVVFHHAGIHSGGTLDFLTDEAMPGNIVIEPFIEGMVQLQRPIAVGAGIPAGVPVIGIQFIEESACNHFLEGGQLHTIQIWHQLLQTAVRKFPELIITFQCQLGCHDGVIHRLLHHDPMLVQEHSLKRQIVCDLHDLSAAEDSGTQICHNGFNVSILAYPVPERNVSCGTCCHGNGDACDVGFMGIQRRVFFLPVFLCCSSFKVEGQNGCVANVFIDLCNAADGFIILHIVLLC